LATVRSAVSGSLAKREEVKQDKEKAAAERVDEKDRAKGMPQSDKPADTTNQPSSTTEQPKP
jgi:hypothetical protein